MCGCEARCYVLVALMGADAAVWLDGAAAITCFAWRRRIPRFPPALLGDAASLAPHAPAGCWRSWTRCEHTAAAPRQRPLEDTAQLTWTQRWPACSGGGTPACPRLQAQRRRRWRLLWVLVWWRSRQRSGRQRLSGGYKPSSRWEGH